MTVRYLNRLKSNHFKIVLRRKGRIRKPFYDIIVINKYRAFVERLGYYRVLGVTRRGISYKFVCLDRVQVVKWLAKGAFPTLFIYKIFKIYNVL